eukprot:Blabericola_migrator_1__10063@NODE_558_length_7604_cov_14_461059_g418_i0_p1_GENE_NODE_558_length_7604_cov_14_461059_g418_i0NODE_558_length_7604_cov_14_461059_g418_i0_p1_ORF_typecomplete_len617_score52_02_NODE_558_length_7604_cov_14_461059_g418_i038835733
MRSLLAAPWKDGISALRSIALCLIAAPTPIGEALQQALIAGEAGSDRTDKQVYDTLETKQRSSGEPREDHNALQLDKPAAPSSSIMSTALRTMIGIGEGIGDESPKGSTMDRRNTQRAGVLPILNFQTVQNLHDLFNEEVHDAHNTKWRSGSRGGHDARQVDQPTALLVAKSSIADNVFRGAMGTWEDIVNVWSPEGSTMDQHISTHENRAEESGGGHAARQLDQVVASLGSFPAKPKSRITKDAIQMAIGEDSADVRPSKYPRMDTHHTQARNIIYHTAEEARISSVSDSQIVEESDHFSDRQVYNTHNTKRRSVEESCDAVQENQSIASLSSLSTTCECPLASSSQEVLTLQEGMDPGIPPQLSQEKVAHRSEALLDPAQSSTTPLRSASHKALFERYRVFEFPCLKAPKLIRQIIDNYSPLFEKDSTMSKMLDLLYLRCREPRVMERELLEYCEVAAMNIKTSATNTSVRLICDWLSLIAMMPSVHGIEVSAERYLSRKPSILFPKVKALLGSLLRTYPRLTQAMALERSRKERLEPYKGSRKRVRGNLSRFVIITSLPLIFQRAESELCLRMIDNLGRAFPLRQSSWVVTQQDCLLNLLATAGHIAQFAESC